jgi:hypothetical protein
MIPWQLQAVAFAWAIVSVSLIGFGIAYSLAKINKRSYTRTMGVIDGGTAGLIYLLGAGASLYGNFRPGLLLGALAGITASGVRRYISTRS